MTFDRRSSKEDRGNRYEILFFLTVKEKIGKSAKVNGCEAFMDIPEAGITHHPLYWRNRSRLTIPIGLEEELQLFSLSSLVTTDQSEIEKHFIFYKDSKTEGGVESSVIEFEQMVSNNEVTITLQVECGGNAPPKPYKTTVRQILDIASSARAEQVT